MNTYHLWDNGWTPCKHTMASVSKLVCSGWCPVCVAEKGYPSPEELDKINGIEKCERPGCTHKTSFLWPTALGTRFHSWGCYLEYKEEYDAAIQSKREVERTRSERIPTVGNSSTDS